MYLIKGLDSSIQYSDPNILLPETVVIKVKFT